MIRRIDNIRFWLKIWTLLNMLAFSIWVFVAASSSYKETLLAVRDLSINDIEAAFPHVMTIQIVVAIIFFAVFYLYRAKKKPGAPILETLLVSLSSAVIIAAFSPTMLIISFTLKINDWAFLIFAASSILNFVCGIYIRYWSEKHEYMGDPSI